MARCCSAGLIAPRHPALLTLNLLPDKQASSGNKAKMDGATLGVAPTDSRFDQRAALPPPYLT